MDSIINNMDKESILEKYRLRKLGYWDSVNNSDYYVEDFVDEKKYLNLWTTWMSMRHL